MSVDLNTVDTIDQLTPFQIQTEKIIDQEVLGEIDNSLKDQYIDLNNLGINLLTDVDYEFKIILFENLLDYCQSNYVNIANFDQIMSSPNKIVEVGSHVYDFICVDCYNTVLIQYLSSINCINVEQFDNYFQRVLDNDISKFKVSFLKTIQTIIDNLVKLQTLDQSVKNNKTYQDILKKYAFYLELINFGESSNFMYNYVKPILAKHEPNILWRMY